MVSFAEFIGYIASVLVAVSLVMASFLLLRVLNLVGAMVFVAYGILIGSIPIIITNGFIVVINIYYLLKMVRPMASVFEYVSVGPERRPQIEEFVEKHLSDIKSFFPDFSLQTPASTFENGGSVYLALRDLAIQGFALCMPVPEAERVEDKDLSSLYRQIHQELFPRESIVLPVDYVVKKYRGIGLTHRLYTRIEENRDPSVRYILSPVTSTARTHRRYLERQGYRTARQEGSYSLLVKRIES